MFVIDEPRTVNDDWVIELPFYHLGHLSLYPETSIYLAPITGSPPKSFPFREILGTTIDRRAWAYIYRLSIKVVDEPGVLHSVMRSVAAHGGNILQLDSTSTDQERYHRIEAIIDFRGYEKHATDRRDRSRLIEGLVMTDCARHFRPDVLADCKISVQPHEGLQQLRNDLNFLVTPPGRQLVHMGLIKKGGRASNKGGILKIPEPMVEMLSEDDLSKESMPIIPPARYFISSNTQDRTFRVSFIPPNREIAWCAIRHIDREGALALITKELRDAGITILASLNRMQSHVQRSWFEVILSKESWANPVKVSLENRRREISDLISSAEGSEEFKLQVYFARSDVNKAMGEPLQVSQAPVRRPQCRIPEWLSDKEKLLKDPMGGLNPEEVHLIRKGLNIVREETGTIPLRLFLSVEFTDANEARIETARRICAEKGMELDVVKKPRGMIIIRDEIIDRIKNATHFVSMWTPSERKGMRNRCSPWLLWELGVAFAMGKPCAAISQEGAERSDLFRILGEIYVFEFNAKKAESFRDEFDACVESVLKQGKQGVV